MNKRVESTLIGYRSRGGRAVINSPHHIDIFPAKVSDYSFEVPETVSSVQEAIDLLRKLAIATPYKSKKVTPIYSRSK